MTVEVVFRIEPAWLRDGAPKWRVEVETTGPRATAWIDPLTDADVPRLPDVPADVTTWRDLLASFSPGGRWTPPLSTMRAMGRLVRARLFGQEKILRRFTDAEGRARGEGRPLRVLFEVTPDDEDAESALPAIPFELAYDDAGFLFKQPARGALRCDPRAGAGEAALPRKGRALVVTAHADGRAPTREALADHRRVVSEAIGALGWTVVEVPDASPAALEDALRGAPERIDLVYVACHGLDDPSYGGRLSLRGGQVTGETLGQWLEERRQSGRPVRAALLCACSSAAPERGEDTSGMAQYLSLAGRADAAIGFRGPVAVDWALGFFARMFARMSPETPLERAFIEERAHVGNEQQQWALPLCYVRRAAPGATLDVQEHLPSQAGVGPELCDPGEVDGGASRLVQRFVEAAGEGSASDLTVALTRGPAPAAQVRELVGELLRGASAGDRKLFLALGSLPFAQGPARWIAAILGEPEPGVSARLNRLCRRGLIAAPKNGLYVVEPILREAALDLSPRSASGA